MTLAQLVRTIKSIAENHQLIRTFGEGDIYDYVDNGGEINYPVCWMVQQTHRYSPNQITYGIQLIFADLLTEDKSNRLDVQSDQLQVAIDFISKLKLDNDYTFNISSNINVETFQERFNDFAAGVSITLDIIEPYPLNYCVIPTNEN
jgi:hypothetical protein